MAQPSATAKLYHTQNPPGLDHLYFLKDLKRAVSP